MCAAMMEWLEVIGPQWRCDGTSAMYVYSLLKGPQNQEYIFFLRPSDIYQSR